MEWISTFKNKICRQCNDDIQKSLLLFTKLTITSVSVASTRIGLAQQADRLQPADLQLQLAGATAWVKNPKRHIKDSQQVLIVHLFHKNRPQEIHLGSSGEPGIYMQE